MKLRFLGLLPALLLLATACSEDDPGSNGSGQVVATIEADNSVTLSTAINRASGEASAMAPEIDDFALKIAKKDGSFTKEWETLSTYDATTKFPTGVYTMEASYGSLEEEGFERPYYYGSTEFTVYDAETATPTLTATLANTMITVSYTEAFKKYFIDYSATIHSDGGDYIEFVEGETRAAYVRPGNITIDLSLTKSTGTHLTFSPAEIANAKARTLYNITFDANGGEVGTVTLLITFDSTTVEEPIEIDLSDSMINSPAPTVVASGFVPGTAVRVQEGNKPADEVLMNLTAMAGFAEINLTTSSTYLLAQGWPAEVNLLNATDVQKKLFEKLGFDASSVWKNLDKMAVLDFTTLISNIRQTTEDVSEHTFTVQVKDNYTKVSEPLTLSVQTTKVNLVLSNPQGLTVGGTTLTLDVQCNGDEFEDNTVFTAVDHYGNWVECPINRIVDNGNGTYTVTLTVPASNEALKIKAVYKSLIEGNTLVVNRISPEYTIAVADGDVWAKHATISISSDAVDTSLLTGYATVYIKTASGTYAKTTDVVKDTATGRITINGLTSSTSYNVKVTLADGDSPEFSNEISFTTETETAVPNGDFESLAQTYNVTEMNMNGRWSPTVTWPWYQNTVSFTISEPTGGWTSVNAKTCNLNASNQNSWFVIPSTYNTTLSWVGICPGVPVFGGSGEETPATYKNLTAQSGFNAMVVRNVAWDENGTTPDDHALTRSDKNNYYSYNVATIAQRSAGKLFLGSYSYSSGTETYNEGVSFASRPIQLNGYYKYVNDLQDSNETGVVTVTLLNGSTVIATGSANLTAVGDYTLFSVPLTYSNKSLKATQLRIMITSSDHASYTQSEETATIKTTVYNSKYESSSYGAILTVDNLTFTY